MAYIGFILVGMGVDCLFQIVFTTQLYFIPNIDSHFEKIYLCYSIYATVR